MTEQLEFKPAEKKPKVAQEDLDLMTHWLATTSEWMSAEGLLRWMGWPLSESNRRKLRALAEASKGKIASGPGTPGYKLTRHVSPEELHLIEGLRTQAERMTKRYMEIMRVWHRNEDRRQ